MSKISVIKQINSEKSLTNVICDCIINVRRIIVLITPNDTVIIVQFNKI